MRLRNTYRIVVLHWTASRKTTSDQMCAMLKYWLDTAVDPPPSYAVHSGHLHIAKCLINKQGCNPSCLDENRLTPLHCAAMKRHIDIVKFLTLER